ncbi:MAG TPA: hypothetical protein DCK93_04490 [Blastocatellia bacterium]|jgi:hypothetical protein|nr:hypothetical protein [Blastocatellia bacterium]HAF22164.1 hypothetical protein [Blastocatellia bacterium]
MDLDLSPVNVDMAPVDVDDAALSLVKFENGAVGTIEGTRFATGRKNYNRFEINGSRGSLVFDLERMNELELYIEEGPWVKRFPDEFYEQMYRLKKWNWSGTSSRRPHVAANYTTNIVYARLGPRILGELEKLNPKTPQGRRRGKHHQWLTDEVGHPQLAQHLYAVIGLMRISDNWEQFMKLLDRAYPKQDEDQLKLFI